MEFKYSPAVETLQFSTEILRIKTDTLGCREGIHSITLLLFTTFFFTRALLSLKCQNFVSSANPAHLVFQIPLLAFASWKEAVYEVFMKAWFTSVIKP